MLIIEKKKKKLSREGKSAKTILTNIKVQCPHAGKGKPCKTPLSY